MSPSRFGQKFCVCMFIGVVALSAAYYELSNPSLASNSIPSPNGCVCDEPTDAKVLVLSKPWHYFDSNHWFHISEYYISRHRQVEKIVGENSTLIIVATEPYFLDLLTEMCFLFLLMAFTNGTPKSVEIYPASPIYPRYEDMVSFLSVRGTYRYSYDSDRPVLSRFSKDMISAPNLCHCGHYIGSFGPTPIERGNWFMQESNDPHKMREKIHSICIDKATGMNDDDVTYTQDRFIMDSGGVSSASSGDHDHDLFHGYAAYSEQLTSFSNHVYFYSRGGNLVWNPPDENDLNPKEKLVKFKSFQTTVESDFPSLYPISSTKSKLTTIQSEQIWTQTSSVKRKVVIYQRDFNRKFKKFRKLLEVLRFQLGNSWDIQVYVHQESFPACLLYHVLKSSDVFLTVHGFQSMGLLFMRPMSLLVEVFPYKYWKAGYAPLAGEYDMRQKWIQSTTPVSFEHRTLLPFVPQYYCMRSLVCRSFARDDDVKLKENEVLSLIEIIKLEE